MKRTIGWLAVLMFAGCAENDGRDGVCSASNTFVYNDDSYCIVIEEGFLSADCPDEYPEGRAFDEFVVCSDADEVVDEVETEARRRGYGTPIEPVCTEGEFRDAGDGCNTCQCIDGGWSCTLIECTPICTDGDTRPAGDGCNTCECLDGAWACTEIACDELATCLAACGDGCPEPQFQSCGVDGQSYCNACTAECYEVELAPDRQACDCPVPAGAPVEATVIVPMELCSERNPEDSTSGVATTNAEIEAWLDCPTGEYPAINEGTEVLLRAVFDQNPDATLTAAYAGGVPAGYVAFLTAPQYCGGPAPMPSVIYVRMPADGGTYAVETCTHTLCEEFFP